MLAIDELVKSVDVDELHNELHERQALRRQMVGQLYPEVLLQEEYRIGKRLQELQPYTLKKALL